MAEALSSRRLPGGLQAPGARALLPLLDRRSSRPWTRCPLGLARPRRDGAATSPSTPALPGRVDLWPVVPKAGKAATDRRGRARSICRRRTPPSSSWRASSPGGSARRSSRTSPDPRAARRRRRPAPARPGDVLILVQRRSELFHEIIRALKTAGLGGRRRPDGADARARRCATSWPSPRSWRCPRTTCRSPPRCARRSSAGARRQLYDLAHGRDGFLWAALRARRDHAETRAILWDLLQRRRLPAPLRPRRADPRPPRRARAAARAAGARGRGRHRRAPEQGARLRADRGAEPDRLPVLDRRRGGRGQAPARRRGRPHPGDDGARRQGPRGADGDPARHAAPRRAPARRDRPRARASRSGGCARTRSRRPCPRPAPRTSRPRPRSATGCSTSP